MAKRKYEDFPIADLVLDFDLYPRTEVSSSNVRLLREAIETGVTLPPIVVDRDTKRVVDGFHRVRLAKSLKQELISVEWRDYASEAAIYEDAVRLNRSHGLPLQRYDLKRAIARLKDLGYQRGDIAEIVRIPAETIERITVEMATTTAGEVVPIKRGLSHLRGAKLSRATETANEKYAGFPAAFYVRQVRLYLESDPPRDPDFEHEMRLLLEAWGIEAVKTG